MQLKGENAMFEKSATITQLPSGFYAVWIGNDWINASLASEDAAIEWLNEYLAKRGNSAKIDLDSRPARLNGGRKGSIMIKDAEREYAAAALYDGGWRAADREQLIAEYELDADEADAICELLRIYEDRRTEFHKK